jgi:hypothetical protein
MGETITQHVSQVFLFEVPALVLVVWLVIDLVFTFVHSYQELRGQQWRYLGGIAGVRIPDGIGIATFFVGLMLILWLLGFAGIVGFVPIVGPVSTALAVGAIGFLIGGRLSDSWFNHIRLDRQGYRPNPALSSTPYYIGEAVLLVIFFSPGLLGWPIPALIGLALGLLFFFVVLPTLRLLRAFPALRDEMSGVDSH